MFLKIKCTFIELSPFSSDRDDFFSSDLEYSNFQDELNNHPEGEGVIKGTGGFRKFRWDIANNKGKSGGCRVIYLHIPLKNIFYLALIFSKSKQVNLTESQKKQLKGVVGFLKQE